MPDKGKGSDSRKTRRPPASRETLQPPSPPRDGGFPLLSLRHIQKGFGIEAMSHQQCQQFLVKWSKRSAFTWAELGVQGKHGLGFEYLTADKFHPTPPESLQEEKYMVFRHDGNHAFAGFKAGDAFYVLWVEAQYDELYKH